MAIKAVSFLEKLVRHTFSNNLSKTFSELTMARKKLKPRRNISRIETVGSGGKKYGGWEVRIQRKGQKMERFFSDKSHGGTRAALAAAKEYRDQIEAEHDKYTVAELSKRPSVRNNSGMVGIRLHRQIDRRGDYEYHYWYWVAQWTDSKGKRRTKSFSVHQYGEDEAYEMACQARIEGVRSANR